MVSIKQNVQFFWELNLVVHKSNHRALESWTLSGSPQNLDSKTGRLQEYSSGLSFAAPGPEVISIVEMCGRIRAEITLLIAAAETIGRGVIFFLETFVSRADVRTHWSRNTFNWWVNVSVILWNDQQMQQCAVRFISLQVHSTCFGRYTRPSSGVQV